nr:hypothetical protein [Bacteroidota bacterium]
MRNIAIILCISFLIIKPFISSAQINIAKIDTNLWKLEKTNNTLFITPKFIFTYDTTIIFYEMNNHKKNIFCELSYKMPYKYYIVTSKGVKTYTNKYFHWRLNINNLQIDSSTFVSLTDSIFTTDYGRIYFMKLDNQQIQKALNSNQDFSLTDPFDSNILIRISSSDLGTLSPNHCLLWFTKIVEIEVPYMQIDSISEMPIVH